MAHPLGIMGTAAKHDGKAGTDMLYSRANVMAQ